jgi:hypothetical protein
MRRRRNGQNSLLNVLLGMLKESSFDIADMGLGQHGKTKGETAVRGGQFQ